MLVERWKGEKVVGGLKDGKIERLKELAALIDNGVADVLVSRVDGKRGSVERWKGGKVER